MSYVSKVTEFRPMFEAEGGGGGTPYDSLFDPPEDKPAVVDGDDVPADLKGKPVSELIAKYREMEAGRTKAEQEKAELVRSLEKVGNGVPPKPPEEKKEEGVAAPTTPARGGLDDVLVDELMELRLERYIKDNPLVAAYRAEVVAMLQNMPDPRARVNDVAIQTASDLVLGRHIKDVMKGAAPTPVVNAAAGSVPAPERPTLEITPERKQVLGMYFGGDMKKAKESIFGGGDNA